MLNQTGVTKTTGLSRKTILYDAKLFFALPCMIAATGVTAGQDGKKIVKAGTPLKGSLLNRDEAFTVGAKDDAVVGIAKGATFGAIITSMGCYYGYYTEGGADGVGKSTTNAVVYSSILILISNYILTAIFF